MVQLRVGFLALVAVALSPVAQALWPIPRTLGTGTSALTLSTSFDIDIDIKGAPQDLKDAASRTKQYLKSDKLGRLVVGRGSTDAQAVSGAKALKKLTVSLAPGTKVKSIASEAVVDLKSRDDAYTLTIPADGSAATLTANSTLGLFRGLTTFSQVFYYYNGKTYTIEAPLAIEDSPAYVRVNAICPETAC
jgi:hexosaminidase